MTAILASCTIYMAYTLERSKNASKIVVLKKMDDLLSIITTEKHVFNLLILLREYHLSGFSRIN